MSSHEQTINRFRSCERHIYVPIGRNWKGETIKECCSCGHRYAVKREALAGDAE